MRDGNESVDVELILRGQTKNHKNLCVFVDPDDMDREDKMILLPISEVSWEKTGKRERVFYDVINVTMPEWLALDRGLI